MAIKPTRYSAHPAFHPIWLHPPIPEAFAVVTGRSNTACPNFSPRRSSLRLLVTVSAGLPKQVAVLRRHRGCSRSRLLFAPS